MRVLGLKPVEIFAVLLEDGAIDEGGGRRLQRLWGRVETPEGRAWMQVRRVAGDELALFRLNEAGQASLIKELDRLYADQSLREDAKNAPTKSVVERPMPAEAPTEIFSAPGGTGVTGALQLGLPPRVTKVQLNRVGE